jgi:hypothetical protein
VANVKLPGPLENVENMDPKQLNIILLNAYNKLLKEMTFLLKNLDDRNIVAESLTADSIAANTITAVKMSVTELSAITANMGHLTAGRVTGAVIENQEVLGNRVWTDSEGFHANDSSGVERITIGTTPAKGAKAVVWRDSTGAEKAAATYDTETVDGASRTGQYYIGPTANYGLLADDGSVRWQTGPNANDEGFRARKLARPEINDGGGWYRIAKESEVKAAGHSLSYDSSTKDLKLYDANFNTISTVNLT